jgi:GNAT superfamily N-acetyltransferase
MDNDTLIVSNSGRGSVFAIRDATEDDLPYIFSNWCNQVRGRYPQISLNGEEFKRIHRMGIMETAVRLFGARIACNVEDPTHIYGWIVASRIGPEQNLYFCYVRSDFRNFGIARALLENEFPYLGKSSVSYTYQTPSMKFLGPKINGRHDPYGTVLFLTSQQKGSQHGIQAH